MLFGNKNIFAVECEIRERIDDWVFGHFIFWLCGSSVGDWNDSADLIGCYNWLNDFANRPRNRYEEELIQLDKYTIYELLYERAMSNELGYEKSNVFENVFSRFHISHIGMSSFDRVGIILVEIPGQGQRCLWKSDSDSEVNECCLPENEMQRISNLCCDWLLKKIMN